MKRMCGFSAFWIAVGLVIALFIESLVIHIMLVIILGNDIVDLNKKKEAISGLLLFLYFNPSVRYISIYYFL